MPSLTPFMYKPHYSETAEPYLVYSVGNANPETTRGYVMQGYWECTHCGEGNQFRFYDDDHHPYFQLRVLDVRKILLQKMIQIMMSNL